jgi:uncharacterized protein (TIGR02217 family)
MSPPLFPALPGITYPVKKTPNWSTDVQPSVSGKITTLQRWSYPKYLIEVGYEFLRMDTAWREYQDLLAFFNLCAGQAKLFRFNDVDDHAVTAQGIGTGDGTTVAFQLARAIGGALYSWVDPVFWPTAWSIYVDGVLVDPANYSITQTGLVTFNAAPDVGQAVTWTGTYDWLVRFSDDSATFEQFAYNLFELKKLSFSSEKI